jgi:type IV pilus assembly protein PilY1
VPCYTTNLGARSLTIVRLDTGKIVRTFRRSKTEVPVALQARVIESPIDSPITGTAVAYPADVGAVAERVFVGDQDGTMWKVSLNSSNPDLWKMSLFWDGFPAVSLHAKPAAGWNDGQPIAVAPAVSVDATGNVTLAFSTGDQTALGASTGMLNYVWSLRDLPDASHKFFADLFWSQQFIDGERVTGPMTLFDSYLYFTTVTPPAPNAVCSNTNGSRLWGMHYVIPKDGPGTGALPPDRTVGGKAAPFIAQNFAGDPDQFVTDTQLFGPGAQHTTALYGAIVAQQPTCYQTDVLPDPYFGSSSKISSINPGKFELIFQPAGGTPSSGGAATSDASGQAKIVLPPVATPAHIESWASIVE